MDESHLFSKYKKIIQKNERIDSPEYELKVSKNTCDNSRSKNFVDIKRDFISNQSIENEGFFDKFKFKSDDLLIDDSSRIDKKYYQKIINGEVIIDDKIDLHGLLVNDAHFQLMNFIKNSFYRSKRLLLVITGIGFQNNPSQIRLNLVNWINGHAIARNVVAFISYAHKKDGGEGAFYLFLKVNRENALNGAKKDFIR